MVCPLPALLTDRELKAVIFFVCVTLTTHYMWNIHTARGYQDSYAPFVAAANALGSPNQLLLETEQLLGCYMERQARWNLAMDTHEVTSKCDAYFLYSS